MTLTTPRYALPYPQGFDVDNVPASMLALATLLDNTMMGFTQGTFAARPAGGSVYGKWYYATDTAALYQYQPADAANPLGWRLMGGLPTKQSARWWANTMQSVTPTYTNANFDRQVDYAFSPGSTWAGTFPNYFDGVSWTGKGWGPGPQPTVPEPGYYRVRGQVAFLHVNPTYSGGSRQQVEQYVVRLFRKGQGPTGSGFPTLVTVVDTHEFFPGFLDLERIAVVEFETIADFDLSSPAQSGVEVYAASSPRSTDHLGGFTGTTVIQNVIGGSEYTFLEMELVAAL